MKKDPPVKRRKLKNISDLKSDSEVDADISSKKKFDTDSENNLYKDREDKKKVTPSVVNIKDAMKKKQQTLKFMFTKSLKSTYSYGSFPGIFYRFYNIGEKITVSLMYFTANIIANVCRSVTSRFLRLER